MSSNAPDEATRETARREAEVVERLRKALKDKRLVILVGAGITLRATADSSGRPLPRLTWTGLIRNGLDYLLNEGHVNASNRRTRQAYDSLSHDEPDSLLDAANIMASQMRQNGQFPTWLESVFGSLYGEVRHPAILEVLCALHQNGATLLTTNYDDILEKACGLQHIGRSNRDQILRFKRGDVDGVFHVHGSYHDPHEVVLDTTDYYQVTQSDEVQNLLKTFLEFHTILFVGCGSGLEDPNFSALLEWASKRQENIPNRHCLLIRNGDSLNCRPLVRLKYGAEYQDLAPYLQKLLVHESKQVAPTSTTIPASRAPLDPPRPFLRNDYTVACICPMGIELAAMEGMLDAIHESLPTSRDQNSYTLGRMGTHNIVVAVMSEIGNNRAASVAMQLLNDFPSIRFGLLVGIGGGIPGDEEEDDIRLGDVVVSKPTATFGGVVQYDMGKVKDGTLFQRTGSLRKPPAVLSASVHRLQAQQARIGSQIPKFLSEMLEKYPKLGEQYVYQGLNTDQLFRAAYSHPGGSTCKNCDPEKTVSRLDRSNTEPRIHYGTIGSGNVVIKDAATRDQLREELGVLCVEMEAAGLMDEFPCLVIRGICDYADSHKNKRWQPYAAATAAAYAKELLSIIPAQELVVSSKAGEVVQETISDAVNAQNKGSNVGVLSISRGSHGIPGDSTTLPSIEVQKQNAQSLIDAAAAGKLKVIQILSKSVSTLDTVRPFYGTALQAATANGHFDAVRELLEKGANPNKMAKESNFRSLAHATVLAVGRGNEDLLQLLLDHKADPTPGLIPAVQQDNVSFVRLLLDRGAKPNEGGSLHHGTALTIAISHSRNDIVQLLLDKGADVNLMGHPSAEHPVLSAIRARNFDGLRLLKAQGADLDKTTAHENALIVAILANDLEAMRLLKDLGANMQQHGKFGTGTPLNVAVAMGNDEIIFYLLSHDVDVNLQGDWVSLTPLQTAAKKGNLGIAKLLIEKGADRNFSSQASKSALQIAMEDEEGDQMTAVLLG